MFYTSAISWTGRYPVPVNCDDEKLLDYWELAQNVLTEQVNSIGILKIHRGNNADSWGNFNEMFNEFMGLFKLTSYE
ncbi:hypothetical protein ABRP68_18360 [Pectobacterium aroidearum]